MRLLLDELYSKEIAVQLRRHGHDVVSVKERPDLEGLKDWQLFLLLPAERRAILTENWSDHDREMQKANAAGMTHYGVIFTSRKKLPRGRGTIGLYVRILDDFLSRHPTDDALITTCHWLPEQAS